MFVYHIEAVDTKILQIYMYCSDVKIIPIGALTALTHSHTHGHTHMFDRTMKTPNTHLQISRNL